ncbi:hypothetical protein Hamer_G028772 [Homarus americanus]|uniref:Uncharacterized protein n=1 Tax=Homarus americanus TaxID=6706 RepID=A0A8J5JC15_HOMAM
MQVLHASNWEIWVKPGRPCGLSSLCQQHFRQLARPLSAVRSSGISLLLKLEILLTTAKFFSRPILTMSAIELDLPVSTAERAYKIWRSRGHFPVNARGSSASHTE